MAVGNFFKRLFSSDDHPIDYAALDDDALLTLSEDRASLTAHAHRALTRELDRRNLAPRTRARPDPARRPVAPPIEGEPIAVLERKGLLLKTQANAAVFVMLPLWDPSAPFIIERPSMKANVTQMLVFNHSADGFLPTSFAIEKLRLRDDQLHKLKNDVPVDRPMPGLGSPVKVTGSLFDRLEIGRLVLETVREDVVLASWIDEDLLVAFGCQVPTAIFLEHPITHVLGGLARPGSDADMEALQELDTYDSLQGIVLMLDCAGVSSWPLEVMPKLGVDVSVVGQDEEDESDQLLVRAKRATDAEDWDQVRAIIDELSAQEIEDLVGGLTLERKPETATRVLEVALGMEDWRDCGQLFFLRGVQHLIAGAPDDAATTFERATQGEEADHRGHVHLSLLHRKRGHFDEAIAAAHRGLEVMADDTIAVGALIAAHAAAGDLEAAAGIADEHAELLGPSDHAGWRARIDDWTDDPDALPYLAHKAYSIGRILGSQNRTPAAVDVFSRCLELMPFHVDATLELGAALGALGRDEHALAAYDAQLEKTPGLSFVRFQRAVCLLRLNRNEEAILELTRVKTEVPDWDTPKEMLATLLDE